MWRPVREGHLTVVQAINMIIRDRFADRHAAIEEKAEAEEHARKRDFVSAGDPLSDAIMQQGSAPSRQLQHMVEEIFSDGQKLLRQWLCDGKIRAFYRDPLFGKEDVNIDASAWETESTDQAIGGGSFYPFGRPTGRYDQKPGAPVKLLRNELEALLRQNRDDSASPEALFEPSVYSPAKIEKAIEITADLLRTQGAGMPRESALAAVKAVFQDFGKDKFLSSVWPVARERLGMPRKGNPGPKANSAGNSN